MSWRPLVLSLIAVLALPLQNCERRAGHLGEEELRELYYFTKALGEDSLTFEAFAAAGRKDDPPGAGARFELRGMRVRFSATLGELGYGTGPFRAEFGARERAAIKRFQTDLGLPASGYLDSLTILHLVSADSALALPALSLPSFGFYQERGWISAHGTWKALSNTLAYPANTADIECNRAMGTCEVVRMDVIGRDLSQLDRIRRETFQVVLWNDELVVAKGEELPVGDSHATLTIHIPTQEVLIRQWSAGDSRDTLFASGPYEMTMKLVDGSQIAEPEEAGGLKDEHARLYSKRDRYLALRSRNEEH
jgi:putative peptidoglycan binding protein